MLREGLPLETALDDAARDLDRPDDRGLAHAIAAEALRWLPDLDALIDRATKKRLPDDAKARFALRIALVQALRLGTPPHAAIATATPAAAPLATKHASFRVSSAIRAPTRRWSRSRSRNVSLTPLIAAATPGARRDPPSIV